MQSMAQVEVERLRVRNASRRRTSEVDDLSRKQGSGTRIFTGKREPVAQSEVAKFTMRVEDVRKKIVRKQWIHGRKKT